jgi:thymidine kinase
MNHNFESGYLSIILGPMWSGKTSKIVDLYKQFSVFCNIKVLPINYSLDTRYGKECISTHDERVINCKTAETLSSIANICNVDGQEVSLPSEFTEAKVILINEGQFFSDINEWVTCAVEKYNKHVYICGLDGDYKREKFGNLLDLIPLCDEVTKLKSICAHCKKAYAIFTHRHHTAEKDQVLIGLDEYLPLCRSCYNEKNCST